MKKNPITAKISPFGRKTTGFSLVEVTLALGIVSFSLVGLLGLLPVGLSNFREARQTMYSAEMIQTLLGKARSMDFTTLQNATQTYYFDAEGVLLDSQGSSAFYKAEVVNPANLSIATASIVSASKGDTTSVLNGNILPIVIKLTNLRNNKILGQFPVCLANHGN